MGLALPAAAQNGETQEGPPAPQAAPPQSPLEAGLRSVLSTRDPAIVQSGRELRLFDLLVEAWSERLVQIRESLEANDDLDRQDLEVLRRRVLDVEQQISERKAVLDREAQDLDAQLKSLGAPPANATVTEPAPLRAQRTALSERLTEIRARIQQSGLLMERSRQIIDRISEYQSSQLRDRLLEQFPSPISPQVVLTGLGDLGRLATELLTAPGQTVMNELNRARLLAGWPTLVSALLGAIGVLLLVRAVVERRFGRRREIENPSFSQKIVAAVVVVCSRGVAPALVVIAPVYAIVDLDLFAGNAQTVIVAAAASLARFLVAIALVRTALCAFQPAWRLTELPDVLAVALHRRAVALLTVLHLALFVGLSANALSASPELLSSFVLIAAILFSLNLLAIIRLRLAGQSARAEAATPADPAGEEDSSSWIDLRLVIQVTLALVAIAVPLIAAAGYSRLANFVMRALLDAGLLIFALFLFRDFVRDLFSIALSESGRISDFVRGTLNFNQQALERTSFWTLIATDILVFLIAVTGIALIIGVSPEELRILVLRLMEGVTIGSITLAPGAIVTAIIGFVVALVVTRLLQRGLTRRIFPRTQIDTGLRHSINAAIGYAGFAIAGLVAIALAGIDLSNIALIAGALSVGIGFGLQAIVNNFVSGLILLAERPVKVGDWIRIGEHEGQVKRINVRSTEIQTFKRTDVILPNSDLISNAVTNYTHKDRIGRLEFPVPVGFDADPDHVSRVLMGIAHDNPNVAKWPESYVLVKGFGSHTMLIELRVYLFDIWNYYFPTISEINLEIIRRFRAEGIPFQPPYSDIHMVRGSPQDQWMQPRVTPIDPDTLEPSRPAKSEAEGPGELDS